MRLVLLFVLLALSLNAKEKIVVMNSNSSIQNYTVAKNSFLKNINKEVKVFDLKDKSSKEIKEYLYDEYPDIIYAIGTKAYKYANLYVPEKTIFFSSIINYQRLDLKKNRLGVSNELYTGVKNTLIKSLFNKIESLTIIYSEYTKDLFYSYKKTAKQVGVKIIGQNISKGDIDYKKLDNTDGLILIADPLLLKDESSVITLFNKMIEYKKPVFAYHKLFIDVGATLVISVDSSIVGQQVAIMLKDYLKKKDIKKIQMPMGTTVIFNKKVADNMKIEYNENAFSFINKVITK